MGGLNDSVVTELVLLALSCPTEKKISSHFDMLFALFRGHPGKSLHFGFGNF